MSSEGRTSSIPLVYENRLKSCLYVLGKFNPCPNPTFKKFDTKGSDYSIFFKRMKIIEKTGQKTSKLNLTVEGLLLFNFLHKEKDFRIHFHDMLLRNLNHYKRFFEVAKSNGFNNLVKEDFFSKLREDLLNFGEDLSIPSFNSIISIAQCVNTIEIETSIIKFKFKHCESDLINSFLITIKMYLQQQQFANNLYIREFSELLRFFSSNLQIDNETYDEQFCMNFLLQHQNELKIIFRAGVGNEMIASQNAIVDFERWFK